MMEVAILESRRALGKAAAGKGARLIDGAISRNGAATIVVATGTSQFEMLSELVKADLDWTRVTAFHLDEYIGIPASHKASFRRYLKERFVDLVPLGEFHYINGEADPDGECERLNRIIGHYSIDVAFIGIGENGHLAFNDPPADFSVTTPYIKVELDLACRRQQFNEGWFASVEDVPSRAISMSVHQIMKSGSIICSVPGSRKAAAVRGAMGEAVTPQIPASILKTHERSWLYLDKESASLLTP
jgi:glucosamine-6-phosphate deaminase